MIAAVAVRRTAQKGYGTIFLITRYSDFKIEITIFCVQFWEKFGKNAVSASDG